MGASRVAWETADFEWTLHKTYRVSVHLRPARIPREAMYLPDIVERELNRRGMKDASAAINGDVLTIETGNDIFGLDATGWHSAIEGAVRDTAAIVTQHETRENTQGAAWLAAIREPPVDD